MTIVEHLYAPISVRSGPDATGKLDPDFSEKFLAFVSHELIRRYELLSRGAIENAPHSTPIYD